LATNIKGEQRENFQLITKYFPHIFMEYNFPRKNPKTFIAFKTLSEINVKSSKNQQWSTEELVGWSYVDKFFYVRFTNYNILDKFEVITLESFDNNHSNIGEVKSYIKRLV